MTTSNKHHSLGGKKVVLLGGSSGIGLATAKAAADEGAQVIIVSSNQERISEALKELPEGCKGYTANLSNEEEVKAIFNQTGNFDHLVFAAGVNLQTLTSVSVVIP